VVVVVLMEMEEVLAAVEGTLVKVVEITLLVWKPDGTRSMSFGNYISNKGN